MTAARTHHQAFIPILLLSLLLWVFYRSIFSFSVLFDETIGKAVFFALPVLLYVSLSGSGQILDSLALRKLPQGLLLGIAFGGLLGFAAALVAAVSRGGVVLLPYYLSCALTKSRISNHHPFCTW